MASYRDKYDMAEKANKDFQLTIGVDHTFAESEEFKASYIEGLNVAEQSDKQVKPSHLWEVIVGNIGTVYSGTNGFEANTTFQTYVGQSNSGYGRAGGEDVTLMKDGELHRQFEGENGRLPICDDCGGEGTEGCICDDLNDATD